MYDSREGQSKTRKPAELKHQIPQIARPLSLAAAELCGNKKKKMFRRRDVCEALVTLWGCRKRSQATGRAAQQKRSSCMLVCCMCPLKGRVKAGVARHKRRCSTVHLWYSADTGGGCTGILRRWWFVAWSSYMLYRCELDTVGWISVASLCEGTWRRATQNAVWVSVALLISLVAGASLGLWRWLWKLNLVDSKGNYTFWTTVVGYSNNGNVSDWPPHCSVCKFQIDCIWSEQCAVYIQKVNHYLVYIHAQREQRKHSLWTCLIETEPTTYTILKHDNVP